MNIKKIIGTFITVLGLGAAVAAPSMAQQQTFASATGGPLGNPAAQSTVFTYTGGPAGAFTTTAGSVFTSTGNTANLNSTMSFMGFAASGPATGTGIASDPYTQPLGGGSFTLMSAGPGSTLLLSGTFTGGNILSAVATSTTASITNTVNNVTYTGGSYFTSSGLLNPGSFSVSMTSVAPPPTLVGGYLSGFTAGGTSTFSAATRPPTTVPEPATIVPFALGGLALLGLMARKTRRTGGMAA